MELYNTALAWTHWGPVTPYDATGLRQDWFRLWPVACLKLNHLHLYIWMSVDRFFSGIPTFSFKTKCIWKYHIDDLPTHWGYFSLALNYRNAYAIIISRSQSVSSTHVWCICVHRYKCSKYIDVANPLAILLNLLHWHVGLFCDLRQHLST